MKTIIKVAGLLAVALFLAAGSAKADSVNYTITSPDGTEVAAFTLPLNPTLLVANILTPSSDFAVFNLPGTVNGAPESFSVDFFTNLSGKSGLDVFANPICSFCTAFAGFEWGTTPLFSGTSTNPTLLTGTFNLSGYIVVATTPQTQVPEPSSLLLLGLGGLAALALGLKRAA